MASFTVLALLQLLALVSAAPYPVNTDTADVVQLPQATYTFPDLVPAGTVTITSTGGQPDPTDVGIIMKERRAATATSDSDVPLITLATTTYVFPNLVPAGTVVITSTGGQPDPTDVGVIMKERRAATATSDSDVPLITLATTTYVFPDLVPAGTVVITSDGGQPAATDIGIIM